MKNSTPTSAPAEGTIDLTTANLRELRDGYRGVDQDLRPTAEGLASIAEDLAERGLTVDDIEPAELHALAVRIGF